MTLVRLACGEWSERRVQRGRQVWREARGLLDPLVVQVLWELSGCQEETVSRDLRVLQAQRDVLGTWEQPVVRVLPGVQVTLVPAEPRVRLGLQVRLGRQVSQVIVVIQVIQVRMVAPVLRVQLDQ